MLGYGVLSLVTAAIATHWVQTEERLIEREILRDVHRQMDALRRDIASLRDELVSERQAVGLQRQQAVEQQRVDQLMRDVE